MKAFHALGSSRNIGERGYGSIPISEITNYFMHYDPIDDLRFFTDVIQRVDIEYVKFSNKKLAAPTPAPPSTTK